MKEKLKPAEVFHPGEVIREEIEERGWSLKSLAEQSGIGCARLEEILAERRPVTRIVAEGLSNAFGTSAQFWVNLQASYDEGPNTGTSTPSPGLD